MINSPCGYDPHHRLHKQAGCGRWVGYRPTSLPGYLPIQPQEPHFYDGVAWCGSCLKDVRHLGQGVFVRPKEESDKVPLPKGPGFKETEDGQGQGIGVGHWERDPESSDWFLTLPEPKPLATGRIQGVRYTEGQCFIVVGSIDAQAPQFGDIVTIHKVES